MITIVGVLVAGSNAHHRATEVSVEIAALSSVVIASVSLAYRTAPPAFQGSCAALLTSNVG